MKHITLYRQHSPWVKRNNIQQRQGQVQCHHVTQFFITEWIKGNWFPELTSLISFSVYCPGKNHLEKFTCFEVSFQRSHDKDFFYILIK